MNKVVLTIVMFLIYFFDVNGQNSVDFKIDGDSNKFSTIQKGEDSNIIKGQIKGDKNEFDVNQGNDKTQKQGTFDKTNSVAQFVAAVFGILAGIVALVRWLYKKRKTV